MTDPEVLAALHARCFVSPRPWSAAEFAALLSDPAVFLCSVGGGLRAPRAPAARPPAGYLDQTEGQGFILGRVVLDEAELLTVAVAPEARRRGLGRYLLAAFEAAAVARGAARAFLEVAEDNVGALALYSGAGWGRVGWRAGYYARPGGAVAALVMARDFAPS